MPTIHRTPEDRFADLPGYDFDPHYLEVEDGLRLHYLDEGPREGPVVLLLHGEPSWSYLYRKMIPILVEKGLRAVAPDLIGFGKSDKWAEQEQYSYRKHLEWTEAFVDALGLNNMTLFCQDWGGLIGLRMVANRPERFSRIVAANTFLPTGERPMPDAFLHWRAFSQKSPDFDIGRVIQMGTLSELQDAVITAYNAPFPSEEYKAGARVFPALVPVEAEDPEAMANKKAWGILTRWEKPFLTLFGEDDPIMRGAEKVFQKLVPGCQGQAHALLPGGHFIQEEQGEELARRVVAFINKNT